MKLRPEWYKNDNIRTWRLSINGGDVPSADCGLTLAVHTLDGRNFYTTINYVRANCGAVYKTLEEAQEHVVTWVLNRLRNAIEELNNVEPPPPSRCACGCLESECDNG